MRTNFKHFLDLVKPFLSEKGTTKNPGKVRFEIEIDSDPQRQKPHATTMDPNKKEKFKKTLIIHCRHEQRLEALKGDMHRIYDSIFLGTPTMDIKLIVGHTNNRSTKRDLTRARPSMKLLNPTKKPSENRILYRLSETNTCKAQPDILFGSNEKQTQPT